MPVYVLVATAIALITFTLGQLVAGLGMVFAIAAGLGWTGFSAACQRRVRPKAS